MEFRQHYPFNVQEKKEYRNVDVNIQTGNDIVAAAPVRLVFSSSLYYTIPAGQNWILKKIYSTATRCDGFEVPMSFVEHQIDFYVDDGVNGQTITDYSKNMQPANIGGGGYFLTVQAIDSSFIIRWNTEMGRQNWEGYTGIIQNRFHFVYIMMNSPVVMHANDYIQIDTRFVFEIKRV